MNRSVPCSLEGPGVPCPAAQCLKIPSFCILAQTFPSTSTRVPFPALGCQERELPAWSTLPSLCPAWDNLPRLLCPKDPHSPPPLTPSRGSGLQQGRVVAQSNAHAMPPSLKGTCGFVGSSTSGEEEGAVCRCRRRVAEYGRMGGSLKPPRPPRRQPLCNGAKMLGYRVTSGAHLWAAAGGPAWGIFLRRGERSGAAAGNPGSCLCCLWAL